MGVLFVDGHVWLRHGRRFKVGAEKPDKEIKAILVGGAICIIMPRIALQKFCKGLIQCCLSEILVEEAPRSVKMF